MTFNYDKKVILIWSKCYIWYKHRRRNGQTPDNCFMYNKTKVWDHDSFRQASCTRRVRVESHMFPRVRHHPLPVPGWTIVRQHVLPSTVSQHPHHLSNKFSNQNAMVSTEKCNTSWTQIINFVHNMLIQNLYWVSVKNVKHSNSERSCGKWMI